MNGVYTMYMYMYMHVHECGVCECTCVCPNVLEVVVDILCTYEHVCKHST